MIEGNLIESKEEHYRMQEPKPYSQYLLSYFPSQFFQY